MGIVDITLVKGDDGVLGQVEDLVQEHMIVAHRFAITYKARDVLTGLDDRMGFYTSFFLPSFGLRPTPLRMSLKREMVVESIMYNRFRSASLNRLSAKILTFTHVILFCVVTQK